MNIFVSRGTTARRYREIISALQREALTYAEVGATTATLPVGYHHLDVTETVGRGHADFEAACRALRAWESHKRAGLSVYEDVPLVVGQDVLVSLPIALLEMQIACRIVEVTDTPTSFGFSYGTLPLHPETGEERFLLTLDDDGAVMYRVTAFSRRSNFVVKLGGPVGPILQRHYISRYINGIREAVAQR